MRRLTPLILFLLLAVAGYLVYRLSAGVDTYDLWVVVGQSNGEGRGDASASVAPDPDTAFEITPAGTLRPLLDPVGGARSGSMWPAFAREYVSVTGHKVLLIEQAHGGTCLTASCAGDDARHWDVRENAWHYGTALGWTRLGLQRARALRPSAEIRLGGWILVQGESDAIAIEDDRTTARDYADALGALLDSADVALGEIDAGARVLVVQTGTRRSGDNAAWATVRGAQDSVASARGALASTAAVRFADAGLMADELHWSQAALDAVGRDAAAVAGRTRP